MWILKSVLSHEEFLNNSSHPFVKRYLRDLDTACARYGKTPLTELSYSAFSRYERDGNRTEYEQLYFDRRGRLTVLALSVWLYHRQEQLEALEEVLWAICNEFTWALPAHLSGHMLSDSENTIVIDLFAAETAQTLSEILSLLSAELSETVAQRCRREIFRRVLRPFCMREHPYGWEKMKNNWAAVCAGCIGMTAVYLVEDTEKLMEILSSLKPALSSFLSSFSDDGACLEGLSYWEYGMMYFTAFLELARYRTGEWFCPNEEKMRRIADFPQSCCLSGGYTVSFSDSSVRQRLPAGLLCRLHALYDSEIPDKSYLAQWSDNTCMRWARAVRDIAWTEIQLVRENQVNDTAYLPQAQWAVMRGARMSAAVKGGKNDEPHNHNDIASFIVIKDQHEIISDLGAGEYTKDYFGDKRYHTFCNGAQGHSVPILNGIEQEAGGSFYADAFTMSDNQVRIEFQSAYPPAGVTKAERKITFMRAEEAIILEDEFLFTGQYRRITERLITKYPVEKAAKSVQIMDGGACLASIEVLSDVQDICIIPVTHHEHDGKRVTVYAIDFILDCSKESGKFRIRIK